MRRAWIAGSMVAAVLAGCGGGGASGPQSAKEVAQAYVTARNSGDAAKVCELYSQQLIQQLRTDNCVGLVREQTSGTATDLTVLRVSQHGDRATATIQARVGGNIANAIAPIELQLAKENGEWRVSGIGGPGSQ
jgi:ketosteroid isomerase-like protein